MKKLKKITRLVFFIFKPFFFLKKHFLFDKKTQKPLSVLFTLHHVILPFSELHNNNLYLSWHSELRIKNVPHLSFRKMLFVSSLQSGKAWQACAQQREQSYSHRNSAISRQVYAHTLLVQHLYSVLFQHIVWCGSTTRTAWMQRRQKN